MLMMDWSYLGKGDTTTRKNLFLLGKPQKKRVLFLMAVPLRGTGGWVKRLPLRNTLFLGRFFLFVEKIPTAIKL